MKLRYGLAALAVGTMLFTGSAFAVELAIVSGAVGDDIKMLRSNLDRYEKETGNTVKIVEMPPMRP